MEILINGGDIMPKGRPLGSKDKTKRTRKTKEQMREEIIKEDAISWEKDKQ